jgi:hypothetical protein
MLIFLLRIPSINGERMMKKVRRKMKKKKEKEEES